MDGEEQKRKIECVCVIVIFMYFQSTRILYWFWLIIFKYYIVVIFFYFLFKNKYMKMYQISHPILLSLMNESRQINKISSQYCLVVMSHSHFVFHENNIWQDTLHISSSSASSSASLDLSTIVDQQKTFLDFFIHIVVWVNPISCVFN